MRYASLINNVKASDWGLNIQEAYLFSWMYELPSWADSVVFEGKTYFFASRNKAIDELPLITNKPDTMYRHYKALIEKGIIELVKLSGKEYICITKKGQTWNQSENSEKNPKTLGKKSENNSEKNPTNNITSINKITKDNLIARKLAFREKVFSKKDENSEMLKDFFDYWSETNENGYKMRFEKQTVFDISRRIATWKKNNSRWNKTQSTASKRWRDLIKPSEN